MKWLVVLVVVALCSSPVFVNASEHDAEESASTEDFAEMVEGVSQYESDANEVAALESQVASEDVDALHEAMTQEAADEAHSEFETETEDEVEAAAEATADEKDEANDEATAIDLAAADEVEEEIADLSADADSFLSASETATESESESEAAEAEAAMEVVAGAPALQFEEDSSDEAADDAEDAEARAEEEAAAMRFKSKPVEYSESLAKQALVYAQVAYYEADPTHCANKLGHKKFDVKHTVSAELKDGSSVFGYTAMDKSKKRLIVGFNGNVQPKELTTALMRGKPLKLKSLCKSCKTHSYYVDAYRKICPEITASVRLLLKPAKYDDYTIMITGHGFGGALASLCGYELEMARVFRHTHKREMITFGAPRFGNAHMARKFNQFFPNAVRITHNNDPFPHVPPCHVNPNAAPQDAQTCFELKDRKKKLWAYHNPTQIWYPNSMPAFDAATSGAFKVCDGANWGEDPACKHSPLGFSMDDHRNYFGVDVSSHCANLIDPPEDVADA